MAKEIKFNVKLLVDGKEQLVTATGNVRTRPARSAPYKRRARNLITSVLPRLISPAL